MWSSQCSSPDYVQWVAESPLRGVPNLCEEFDVGKASLAVLLSRSTGYCSFALSVYQRRGHMDQSSIAVSRKSN